MLLPWRRAECESWWFVHDCPLGDSRRILTKMRTLSEAGNRLDIKLKQSIQFETTQLFFSTSSFPSGTNIFQQCVLMYWPLTLLAAAARTSASQSLRRFWKAGTRSFLVISGPTAFWSYIQKQKKRINIGQDQNIKVRGHKGNTMVCFRDA